MALLHKNTTFDPQERAVAIVAELEKEVIDEDMMHAALQAMVEVFASRQAYSVSWCNEDNRKRVVERRRDRENAKLKGIPPAPLKGNIIQPGLIPPSKH